MPRGLPRGLIPRSLTPSSTPRLLSWRQRPIRPGEEYIPGTGTEPLTQAQADQLEAILLVGGMDPAQVAKELEAHGYVRDERTPEQ